MILLSRLLLFNYVTAGKVFRGPGLVISRPRECELEEVAIDESDLAPGDLVIEAEYSVVSAGTEVANYTALDPGVWVAGSWNAYPYRPGYGAVGAVVACGATPGDGGSDYGVGDRVFAIARHARFSVVNPSRRPVVRLRSDDDAKAMVLARMASVAITAVPKSASVDLGGRAVVIGLGLVGNFAAQLLQLSGMDVLGLDRASRRVEMAQGVGLEAKQVAETVDLGEVWGDCDRCGPDLVVEASGVSDVIHLAVRLTRDGGEVVLLGSPRGGFQEDTTAMLSDIHHRGIRVVGALEWLLPLQSGPRQSRWSLSDDYRVLFGLFRRGRIRTDKLVSDIVAPRQAPSAYRSLAQDGSSMGAVLFDWQ